VPSQDSCAECLRLWWLYAYATRQHIEIIQAWEKYSPRSDDAEKWLARQDALQGAEEWRAVARKALNDHETATHGLVRQS